MNYAILTGEYPLFSFFRTVLTGRSHHVVTKSLSQHNEVKEQELAERISRYINAATRDNTRKTYRSAVEHFEVHWGGKLPTTPEHIGRYLVSYADSLAPSTLKTRLAALSQWHKTQGFADPCSSVHVRKIMRGIQAVHSKKPKQAHPLQIEHLQQITASLDAQICASENNASVLRAYRDKALVLLGFWRGFRSDELSRLMFEDLDIIDNVCLRGYVRQTKTDRHNQGMYFEVPALQTLCPVNAMSEFAAQIEMDDGPVFRKIDRWGKLNQNGISAGSIPAILRRVLIQSKIPNSKEFSSHSLRRGFAHWANQQGWSLHELMQYVGWKDIQSAMRYLNRSEAFPNRLTTKNSIHLID